MANDHATRQYLKSLVEALENAYISSWHSTSAWQKELDDARKYLDFVEEQCDHTFESIPLIEGDINGPQIPRCRKCSCTLNQDYIATESINQISIPHGWKLVPVNSTHEMISAALKECGGIGGGSCGEYTGLDGSDFVFV